MALKHVRSLIKPYTASIWILCALVIGVLILDLAWPLLTKFLVDHVLEGPLHQNKIALPYLDSITRRRALIYVVMALAGIHVVRAFLTGISSERGWVTLSLSTCAPV
jgi:hypothetical protein